MDLNQRRQLEWSESFLDGIFATTKKGAPKSEKPSGARVTKSMVVDGCAIPAGDHLCSASPSEVRLAETTLAVILSH